MFVLFWVAKGGAGATVVACASALASARRAATVLVDLGGDACAALGVPDTSGAGVHDWLAAPHAPASTLFELGVSATGDLSVVGPGTPREAPLDAPEWERLATACRAHDTPVVLDAGSHRPTEAAHHLTTQSLLVTRPCFLALRRAAAHHGVGSGAVLVEEPGRALRAADVERALGLPVRLRIPWDPAIARAVDAGLLAARLPATLLRELRHVTAAVGR